MKKKNTPIRAYRCHRNGIFALLCKQSVLLSVLVMLCHQSIQMILRLGYVDDYAEPISKRRAVPILPK